MGTAGFAFVFFYRKGYAGGMTTFRENEKSLLP
jgi:hypothetical protein